MARTLLWRLDCPKIGTHMQIASKGCTSHQQGPSVGADVDAAVRCPTAVQIQTLGISQDMGTSLLADGGVTDASPSTQAHNVYCAIWGVVQWPELGGGAGHDDEASAPTPYLTPQGPNVIKTNWLSGAIGGARHRSSLMGTSFLTGPDTNRHHCPYNDDRELYLPGSGPAHECPKAPEKDPSGKPTTLTLI